MRNYTSRNTLQKVLVWERVNRCMKYRNAPIPDFKSLGSVAVCM
jgi:hypothetical protein